MLRSPSTTDDPAPQRVPDPAPPAPLLVQRGLFAGPSLLVPADLYARVVAGTARRDRGELELAPGSHVTTNTYFGRFPATYWQRWTTVTEVQVEATVTGTGQLRLLASDTNRISRVAAARAVSGADGETVRLSAAVDRFLDGGGMWLEASTELGGLVVADVRWTVAAPERVRPASVVICTFNRVDDCLNTLQALLDDPVALGRLRQVIVADQGTDPLESRPRFGPLADHFGERLRYLRQPNLGGAGGFTRGMFELTRGTADTDIVLMDDDVLLEPEIVVRLTGFANRTARPTIVGGQMLNLLHPSFLHIGAEYADPENLRVGIPMPGAFAEQDLLAIDDEGLPAVQDRRVDTEYNGWWSCLIPSEIVRAVGYPLPLFFQWDDIEFGYRARHAGYPTVALPGAGVWHADFGWKDWDEWHRYFNLRNGLITAALRTGFSVKRLGATMVELLARYLVAMQYGLAATLLQALEDFLAGPDILADGSAAAAAEIRRIRAAYPETRTHPVIDAADGDFRELTVVRAAPPPSRTVLTWAKRAVTQLTGRTPHHTGLVPAGDAHWWHVANFSRVIVTDMAETGVRIRTRDRAVALGLARRGALLLRRFRSEGPAVAQRWRDAVPELTSRANWARLYGLSDDGAKVTRSSGGGLGSLHQK